MATIIANQYDRAKAITPDNSINIDGSFAVVADVQAKAIPCDAIYVGTVTGASGTLTVVFQNDVAVTFTGVLSGRIYELRAVRVNSTGTDASNLLALYRV